MNRPRTVASLATATSVIFAVLNAPRLQGQSGTNTSAFDVASVKQNRSGAPLRSGPTLQPGGRVIVINMPLREVIRVAYGVEENQIDGGPSWSGSDAFDISATAAPDVSPDEARAMLRTLLAERFKLAVRTETRQLPTYALVTAKGDGKTGGGLRRSGAACAPVTLPTGAPPPPPPPPALAGRSLTAGPDRMRCPTMFFTGQISARAFTMEDLALGLSRLVRRPVIDRTGLTGTFDIDLKYTPDLQASVPLELPTDAPPSLFTAMQEQLGLKLDSQRGPVDVLVIERVEPPTEN